jgi:hypothetical protein
VKSDVVSYFGWTISLKPKITYAVKNMVKNMKIFKWTAWTRQVQDFRNKDLENGERNKAFLIKILLTKRETRISKCLRSRKTRTSFSTLLLLLQVPYFILHNNLSCIFCSIHSVHNSWQVCAIYKVEACWLKIFPSNRILRELSQPRWFCC